jgi:hypothetical protein
VRIADRRAMRAAWTSLPNWLRLGLQGLLVFLATWLFAYAIMLIANLRPSSGGQCPWQFPKILSCLLGTNLAGGVVGAGGALIAAWIAWMAVQRQIEEQQRQARVVERAYISGGGPCDKERLLFILTAQNYGKTPGTLTAYAVSVVDRTDLPQEPAYNRKPLIATFPPGGGTLPIATHPIPPVPNPIAYGRLWYNDIWGDEEYHFSFIIPIQSPLDHADLVGINKAYTSST